MTNFLLVLGLIALCVITVVSISVILARPPAYALISAPFVYPDGSRLMLATQNGPYTVEGPTPPGCYRLKPPQAGEAFGSAEYAGPVCP